MEKTLQVINKLQETGLINKYAIGGAMAATFYVEPILTYDLDIFIILPESISLAPLSSIYEYLQNKGYTVEKECILIEGIPVQFLPAYNKLLNEALENADEVSYGTTATFALKIEYLSAICLQTERQKDKERVRLFKEEAKIDMALLQTILRKFGLERKWNEWTT
ncbi:MAG: hypothetical protein GF350_13125 [Chitinivibrionales bacterium]|nr:hypothetical protein [Chitinivibrionales bacterium]